MAPSIARSTSPHPPRDLPRRLRPPPPGRPAAPPPPAPIPTGPPPPPPPAVAYSNVSPPLAFCLGWIPGVGAIYNGQYAKGLVHAFIWGILMSMADSRAAHVA